jgi:hypothetical protein
LPVLGNADSKLFFILESTGRNNLADSRKTISTLPENAIEIVTLLLVLKS